MNPAVKNLLIHTIQMKSMAVSTYDDFDPDDIPEDIFENGQSYRSIRKIQTFKIGDTDNYQHRFTYSIGLRFVSTYDRKSEIPLDEIKPYVEFKATFIADYQCKLELDEENLDSFANSHLCYHIWPYWREFVQSTCGRLSLPCLVVPPFRVKVDVEE